MDERFYFDARLGDAAVDFFPKYLRLVDAEWAGRPFHLADWQKQHTRQIFGWRRRTDGLRRYRRVRGWVPKKNGKSEWAAGIAHLLCVGDGEPGAFVPVYATDKNQAKVIFEKATRMVALDVTDDGRLGPLAELYEQSKTGLFCPHLMSSIVPLSGDPTGKHGPAPHGAIGDEAHEWPDGRLHRFLVEGMASRRQPMDLVISTAGEIKTYAHELYEESKSILADPSLDAECYVFIHEAPQDADWTDPKVWALANPNMGISPKREFLESECEKAKRNPRLENDFRRYHLNQWVEQQKRWLPMHRWAANTAAPKNAALWRSLAGKMAHRRAFAGLDLGSTDDITALVWLFMPEEKEKRVVLIPRFWVPEDKVAERDSPRTPYKRWIAEGALFVTPGNVTDYDFIEQQVMTDAEAFKCDELAIDRWNATQVGVHLGEQGLKVKLFGQGFNSMGAPSKEIERLFISGGLEHGNHPVMQWMFGNAAYRKDPAGNIKPDKERAAEKIDGLVAAVMALGLAMASAKPIDLRKEIAAGRLIL